MKKTLILIFVICIFTLSGCGGKEKSAPNPNTVSNLAQGQEPTEGSGGSDESVISHSFDYAANTLSLVDLKNGSTAGSYHFDSPQSPVSITQSSSSIHMISTEGEADIKNTNGLSIFTGESEAAEMFCWQFDLEMNLQKSYKFTNQELIGAVLGGEAYSISPDGKKIIYSLGNLLYCYEFETQETSEQKLNLGQDVIFTMIAHSKSGNSLVFTGDSLNNDNDAVYGAIDLNSGNGKCFVASDFTPAALVVNGEYAVVADIVLPDSMGGALEAGKAVFVDMAKQEGKLLTVESGEESNIISVSEDGKYVITCCDKSDKSGVIRCYNTSDGKKCAEKNYETEQKCVASELYISNNTAYAVLSIGESKILSPAIELL